ncbi:MAG: nucleoside deaminase, partial [Candidatus Aminicenantes bacterium]
MKEVAKHVSFMREALLEAARAEEKDEVPVGALVISESHILSRAHNRTISVNDPTAHAEILAIREACRIKKNYRLPGCDLYVTLEPCPMCLGAILQARIRRLIF